MHEGELLLRDEQRCLTSRDETKILAIMTALDGNVFTSKFDQQQRNAVAEAMLPQDVVAGEIVIKEAEQGDRLYVTETGLYDMSQRGVIKGSPIGPFQVLGEMAILYKCNRTATITAIRPGRLWYIDLNHFHMVLYNLKLQLNNKRLQFLQDSPLLQGLTQDFVSKIVDSTFEEFYRKGDIVLDFAEEQPHFYFIMTGEVQVVEAQDAGRAIPLHTLSKGAHFGEATLMGTHQGMCSYKALSEVQVIKMDKIAFDELIVPLEALGRLKYDPNAGHAFAEPLSQNTYSGIELNQLVSIATLGQGGFGRVDLVETPTKERLALKMLAKSSIVEHGQEDHVMSEKRVLEKLKSPFLIALCATYKDDRFVYLMMDVCLGGELWQRLRVVGHFEENAARFYTASVIEGISYLHGMGVIYRDLKPENLMLTANGYIKMVDFGFAKSLKHNEKTWTFCGTPDYMSPEIVLNQGHDHGTDLWSIGILIFELITGKPPFYRKDAMDTYNFIISGVGNVEFPAYVSEHARSLVQALCREHPTERIGNLHDGMQGLRAHPWFKGFHWSHLLKQTLEAPFLPKVREVKSMKTHVPLSSAYVGPLAWDTEF